MYLSTVLLKIVLIKKLKLTISIHKQAFNHLQSLETFLKVDSKLINHHQQATMIFSLGNNDICATLLINLKCRYYINFRYFLQFIIH
jgi:hypothetical protein